MDEPKVGEWWEVEIDTPVADGGPRVVGRLRARLIAPAPAPEPTEAEKVDALIEAALANHKMAHPPRATYIRECIEAAGYVLAPTSGPGFEEMRRAMQALMPPGTTDGEARVPLSAALDTCKGRG